MKELSILCLGDIVGNPGRRALKDALSHVQEEHKADITIANIENAAGGFGVTQKIVKDIKSLGIDVFTSGNHIYRQKEFVETIDNYDDVLRPLNFPKGSPGKGICIAEINGIKIAVINLIGRVFMGLSDCPFQIIEAHIEEIQKETRIILVDFHGEATSEKQAMGWYLDGKVSTVFGTHTHVQTADETILPKGTGYITDIGMTGAKDSILGMEKEPIIQKFFDQMPVKFNPSEATPLLINGICVTIDAASGKTTSIVRIKKEIES